MPEEPKTSTAPAEPNASLYAAVDRMRDLAKWLIVILGAIGGTLIAGSQLSDIGAAEGSHLFWAGVGLFLSLVGVGIAVGFTVRVLVPAEMTLPRLAKAGRWSAAAKLASREPEVLFGRQTIAALEADRQAAKKARDEAATSDSNGDALEKASESLKDINAKVHYFLGHALVAQAKRSLNQAFVAMLIGSAVAAAGICLFAWATHPGEADEKTTKVVPKQPSTVLVRLSPEGRRVLSTRLGARCNALELHALAVGGEPGALDLIATPGARCKPLRFTLTGRLGAVVSDEGVRALP